MMRYFGQIIQIKMPDLGEGTKEATIKEWFVKEGTLIKEVQLIESIFILYFNSMTIYVKYLQINQWRKSLQLMMESLRELTLKLMMFVVLATVLSTQKQKISQKLYNSKQLNNKFPNNKNKLSQLSHFSKHSQLNK